MRWTCNLKCIDIWCSCEVKMLFERPIYIWFLLGAVFVDVSHSMDSQSKVYGHGVYLWQQEQTSYVYLRLTANTVFPCAVYSELRRKNSGNINPLSANPTKWSNTLKQFVGNLPTNCLSVFDDFVNLALKGLNNSIQITLPVSIKLHLHGLLAFHMMYMHVQSQMKRNINEHFL